MSRLRARPARLARNAAAVVRSAADDALALAGVACLAVAAGFLLPAGPWLVVGLFLLASATAGKRRGP